MADGSPKDPRKRRERAAAKLPTPSSIEEMLKQATASGAFDDLPGAGKPFADRSEPYRPDWWARKLVEREQLNIVPPALEIRGRIEKLLASLAQMESESAVLEAVEALNRDIAHTNARVTSGPATAVSRLDPERTLARWREQRTR